MDYDPKTGQFIWKIREPSLNRDDRWFNSRWAGRPAGRANSDGYIEIKIDGVHYKAARLAWFYVTGQWPPGEIDHKDRNRANNRFGNLRPATRVQNTANRNASGNNTSGYKGVTWNRAAGKWQAQIGIGGRLRYLGCFNAKEEVAAAYDRAARDQYGEFAA